MLVSVPNLLKFHLFNTMETITLSSAECKALLEAIVDCDEALYVKIKECANKETKE